MALQVEITPTNPSGSLADFDSVFLAKRLRLPSGIDCDHNCSYSHFLNPRSGNGPCHVAVLSRIPLRGDYRCSATFPTMKHRWLQGRTTTSTRRFRRAMTTFRRICGNRSMTGTANLEVDAHFSLSFDVFHPASLQEWHSGSATGHCFSDYF